jgi:hypothetical protein
MTSVWLETGTSGVPVGVHTETPDMMATGWPCEKTCVDPTTHCAETHGPLPPFAGVNAHPATAYGGEIVAMGMPETKTQVLGTVGMAWPPCAQVTTAPS